MLTNYVQFNYLLYLYLSILSCFKEYVFLQQVLICLCIHFVTIEAFTKSFDHGLAPLTLVKVVSLDRIESLFLNSFVSFLIDYHLPIQVFAILIGFKVPVSISPGSTGTIGKAFSTVHSQTSHFKFEYLEVCFTTSSFN